MKDEIIENKKYLLLLKCSFFSHNIRTILKKVKLKSKIEKKIYSNLKFSNTSIFRKNIIYSKLP